MSVVIAAKYRNGIAMIADKQATQYNTKIDNATKVQPFKYSNSGIGVVGYLRDCNVMRLMEDIIPAEDILKRIDIDELYVIRNIVPRIMNHLGENKRLNKSKDMYSMESEMLYATDKNIFKIGEDFSVAEADTTFATIGCGSEKVIGYLATLGDTSKYSRKEITDVLCYAVQKACEKDVYINDSVDLMYFERREDKYAN